MTDAETLVALKQLAGNLADAKLKEEGSKATRIAIEEEIAALIPGPERGQKTVKLDDGTKITVERGFNYKADCQKIVDYFTVQDEKDIPIKFKTTRELDDRGYEWYRTEKPEIFSAISQFVTVTPKKVSVAIRAGVK